MRLILIAYGLAGVQHGRYGCATCVQKERATAAMHRLSYHSHALAAGPAALDALYAESAAFNAKADITGALLFLDGRFAQILEGDQAAITRLYDRITRDPRHDHVTLDYVITTEGRLFPCWSMARITDDDKADIPLARILAATIAADSDTKIRQLRSLTRCARRPLSDAGGEAGNSPAPESISLSQSRVCRILGNGRLQRPRPPQPLHPGDDLGIIQAGVIAAVRTDELEDVGVTALRAAVHHPDWLPPQDRRQAVVRMTSGRNPRGASAWPQATSMAGLSWAYSTYRISRRGLGGHGMRVWTAQFAPRWVSLTALVWSSTHWHSNCDDRTPLSINETVTKAAPAGQSGQQTTRAGRQGLLAPPLTPASPAITGPRQTPGTAKPR